MADQIFLIFTPLEIMPRCSAAGLDFRIIPAGFNAPLEFLTGFTTDDVSDQWISSTDVHDYVDAHPTDIPGSWFSQSAGNIWSSDTIVGDALTGLEAGVYRISAVDGAFTYDSFNWSGVADQWLWQLQIYAIGAIEGNETKDVNYTLGSGALYGTGDDALAEWAGKYMDITLAAGGELIFWIADGRLDGDPSERNTIDNSGFLKFDVTEIPTPIPEPSTLILIGTGLFFLVRRSRRSFTSLN